MKTRYLASVYLLSTTMLTEISFAEVAGQIDDHGRETRQAGVVLGNYPGGAISLDRFDHANIDIDIDGRVDEDIWAGLSTHGNLEVTEPDTLGAPSFRTDLRIFYTERGIFISFDMEQSPETLVERYSVRDNFQMIRDSVSISLDMSGSGRYGYWVSLSLGDNQADGTILPERQYSRNWDGAWYGATAVTETGWSAEFFVPGRRWRCPGKTTVETSAYTCRAKWHI